ncbi:MAG: DUF3817 domain-containing protein [Euryarchaeota archaeon]|nr:DUF3817 domain-containing protein [Euryarchaeota archaeon]
MDRTTLVGYIEGTSTLLLMGVAVPFKYIGGNEILVKILGPIHGMLFLLYLDILFFGVGKQWTSRAFAIGFIAAVIPGGPFIFDRKLQNGTWSITSNLE